MKKQKRMRKYGVIYKELPFGGIGKDVIFSQSKAKIIEDCKNFKNLELQRIVFLGWGGKIPS